MARITTASLLTSTEVTIDPVGQTVKLNIAGNMTTDGVSLRTLYAFLKLQWKGSAALITYPFPMVAITNTKFDFVSGWNFLDTTSRNLIRDGGWSVKNPADNITSYEEWMNFNTVGAIGATEQVYYTQSGAAGSSTGTPITYTGVANAAIKVYGDATHGAFDYRSNFTAYVRSQGKTYDIENLANIGLTTLSYGSYFFPLVTGTDSTVTDTDSTIDTAAIYTGMSITYNATAITRTIAGTAYSFTVNIAGNGGTRQQVYQYVQRQLRKSTTINSTTPAMLGATATSLLKMVGTQLVTSTGVYIDNLAATEADFVDFYDNTAIKRNASYQAAGIIQFNTILTNDVDAIYRVYFTSTFGTSLTGAPAAVLVNDASGTAISGTVSGKTSLTFSFDYDGNVQGGRTASTDAAVTIVALGIISGQYTTMTGTITRSIANRFYIASSAERNYYPV